LVVPKNEWRFPIERLHQIKADHEAFVRLQLHPGPATDKQALARKISPLLVINHQVWLNHSPLSELARKIQIVMQPMLYGFRATWDDFAEQCLITKDRQIGRDHYRELVQLYH
jgi:hypothetical protein